MLTTKVFKSGSTIMLFPKNDAWEQFKAHYFYTIGVVLKLQFLNKFIIIFSAPISFQNIFSRLYKGHIRCLASFYILFPIIHSK
jgi:hypothetical protein